MRYRRLKNPAIARHVDVHEKTVSKWRSGVQVPRDTEIVKLAEVLGVTPSWLKYGQGKGPGDPPRANDPRRRLPYEPGESDEMSVMERTIDAYRAAQGHQPGADLSLKARAEIADFEAEAYRLGAQREDVQFIRATLENPAAYVNYVDGRPREMVPSEQLVEVRGLIEMLRAWLQVKMKRRNATGRHADDA